MHPAAADRPPPRPPGPTLGWHPTAAGRPRPHRPGHDTDHPRGPVDDTGRGCGHDPTTPTSRPPAGRSRWPTGWSAWPDPASGSRTSWSSWPRAPPASSSTPPSCGTRPAAFGIFCLAASGTYYLNDARDAEADRRHPTKRNRPVAAGVVPVPLALTLGRGHDGRVGGTGRVAGRLAPRAWSWAPTWPCSSPTPAGLKNEPILDLACVSAGFILRAVAGGVATSVPCPTGSSSWSPSGRSWSSPASARARSSCWPRAAPTTAAVRQTLGLYTPSFLRTVRTLSAAVTVSAYCLWAFERASQVHPGHDPIWFQLTIIPFVIAPPPRAAAARLGRRRRPRGAGPAATTGCRSTACAGWPCSPSGPTPREAAPVPTRAADRLGTHGADVGRRGPRRPPGRRRRGHGRLGVGRRGGRPRAGAGGPRHGPQLRRRRPERRRHRARRHLARRRPRRRPRHRADHRRGRRQPADPDGALRPARVVRAGHPGHPPGDASAGRSPPTSTARTTTSTAASAPTSCR